MDTYTIEHQPLSNILQRRPIGAINAAAFNYPPPTRPRWRHTRDERRAKIGRGWRKARVDKPRGEYEASEECGSV